VQPLLVTSLLLAIPLSAAVDHRKVKRAEIYGALLCCAGLAAFLLAARPSEGNQQVTGEDGLLLLASVGPVVLGLLIASTRLHGVSRSVALALSGDPGLAVRMGNTVASVTIMKRGTGTASASEVLAATEKAVSG